MQQRLKILLLLLIINFNAYQIVFSQGCIDSVTLHQFNSPYLGSYPTSSNSLRDDSDNIYINGTSSNSAGRFNSLLKINANNEVVYFKNYHLRLAQVSDVQTTALTHIDNEKNLIFIGTDNVSRIIKLDSSANLVWAKKIFGREGIGPEYSIKSVSNTQNDNLYFSRSITSERAWVLGLDKNGSILFSRTYSINNYPQYQISQVTAISHENNLIVFCQFSSNPLDPFPRQGLHILKINGDNGNIITQKTFNYYNDPQFVKPNNFSRTIVNYNTRLKIFLLDSWGEKLPPYFGKAHILSLLDQNLNLIKSAHFFSERSIPHESITIDKNNFISITDNYPLHNGIRDHSLIYCTINDELEIISQKKIPFQPLSIPDYNIHVNMAYKANGMLNIQIARDAATQTNNPLYIFNHSPFYYGINKCLGYDTLMYMPAPIYHKEITGISFTEGNDMPVFSTPATLFSSQNISLPRTEICKEISICDTLKINGTQQYCLSQPIARFNLVRNSQCKRKTKWELNTSAIEIINSTDSNLDVKFLSPYLGYIYASFGGCALKDSLWVEVYQPRKLVSLGKDTTHCPGKTISLDAGPGYKYYEWQDGSNSRYFLSTNPGQYHVTVTDSCNNISRDTLLVKPMDAPWLIDYPLSLCLYDTAAIKLPLSFYNITWQPNATGSLNANVLNLFPATTTIYSLSAERLPGCILSDTVLIAVKNCPVYIYFPTAFTPNNDGINDTYKPLISGRLLQYDFAIYNRWGQIVFKTNNPYLGWRGLYKGSSPILGSYVFTCNYQFINTKLVFKKGNFTLIK